MNSIQSGFKLQAPAFKAVGSELRLPPPAPGSEIEVFDLFSTPDQEAISEVYALPKEAAPALQRPVLLVHGFNGGATSWKNMRTWLTQTAENQDGGVVGPQSPTVNGNGKVFTMEFSRPYNSVKSNAAELRAAVDRIVAATGGKDIDIVAHSKGGLDTRYYLDQGNEKINKFVEVGSPNRGSVLADIELQFRELGVSLYPKTDDPEVRQALTDLKEDRKVDGRPNNPMLAELNSNWERQRSRADILLIAANGIPTLKSKTFLTHKGDGVVPRSSVQMPNTPLKNVWWTNHLSQRSHPDVLTTAANFLVGKAIDLKDPEPTVPADQEIVPAQVAGDKGQVQYTYHEKKAS